MKKQYDLPDVVEKDPSEIKDIISQIKASSMPEDVKAFIIKCVELALWLPIFLQNKAISMQRLRTMIFGKGYNKKPPVDPLMTTSLNDPVDPPTLPPKDTTENEDPDSTLSHVEHNNVVVPLIITNEASNLFVSDDKDPNNNNDNKEKKGHGRMSHTVYTNATDIQLLLSLTIGDDCPFLCGGRLGPYKPGIFVRVMGQNFADVYRYHVEKLRCNLCGVIIKPEMPAEIGDNKYDTSFIALIAIMKYYVAIPFYRQEQFQRMLGFPLSDSTQWHLIEQLAGFCYAVFNELKRMAANGQVLQNDDTVVRILEVIKQIKDGTIGDRTGMYTTGMIADYEGHRIALFINGQQHSGENVGDILQYRDPDKDPIIQMCDALSANIPKKIKTILSNCLSHGFRKFNELRDHFPKECLIIIRLLSRVFKYDKETRDMPPDKRLIYHQEHSKPLMDELKRYISTLLTERRVEPNSELGLAIKYMLKHWEKLTRFLTVAGAPIDNNIVERALKIAIRNRKAALFYRTLYSAGIGGMITSLIYTCDLADKNPQHYLIALQEHQSKVLANPALWLPWNYQSTLAKLVDGAKPQAPVLPSGCLAAA